MELSQDDFTAKQTENGLSKWAVFLPAISGFYAAFIGKQRNEQYVDPARFPCGLTNMEQLNWLNASNGLFTYKWSLYSGGHANLDLSKQAWGEDMVRNRDPNTFMLGDSGGFQIAKGLWIGEWRDPTSVEVQSKLATLTAQGPITTVNAKGKTSKIDPAADYQKLIDAAQKKRETVLKWLDGIADYGMILDIPTWVINDKKASAACGITTLAEAVAATKYNNLYFMAHRKGKNNGGAKFLNVLQGENHTSADAWYQEMKDFCDPTIYPDTHFDGWAMGGQNMCDVDLVLRRLVALRYDNLLQEGKHDWMHFLGTSKLEWAVLLTVIQQAVRKYVNPAFTISFDCASPFLATANGQVYHHIDLPPNEKWCYRMSPSVDDKKYAADTRSYRDVIINDGFVNHFDESPISKLLKVKDICIYKPGVAKPGVTISQTNFQDPTLYNVLPDQNKNGKWGKTSWDSFSYALLMGHNVWTHIESVQRANTEFAAGNRPAMMQRSTGDYEYFETIVDAIFAAPDRESANSIIEYYSSYWMEIVGTRGFKGKKTVNSNTMFNALYNVDDITNEYTEPEFNEEKLDQLGEF
jgi:hypothetical protein